MRRQWTRWAGAALLISGAYGHFRAPQPPLPHHVGGTIIPQIGHVGGIRAFVIAPDGKTVATLGKTIKFWDTQSGALLRTLSLGKAPWQPRDLRFSPDGSTLAFLDDTPDGTQLRLVDTASGRLCPIKTPVGYSRDFAFIEKERVCLTVNEQLRTYDIASGRLLQINKVSSVYPWGAVAGDVALTGYGKQWALCNLQTGRTQSLQRNINLQAAAFSADGRVLLTGQNRFPAPQPATRDRITFSIVSMDEDVPQIKRAVRPVSEPAESPDGTLALWDVQKGKLRRVITAFPAQVGAFRGVALSRTGHLAAAYGSETYKEGYRTCVKLWDCTTGRLKGEWALNSDGFLMTALAVADDGNVSVVGLKTDASGVAGAPQVWNSRTRQWRNNAMGNMADEWRHLEWSPNGTMLAGSSEIGSPLGAGWRGPGGFAGYYYSAYSLGGAMPTFIFSGGPGFAATTIRLWDLNDGKMRPGFWGPIVPPRHSAGQGVAALQQGGLASVLGVCAFSPDNRLLASDEGGTIALRDVKSGAVTRTLAALPPNFVNVGDWSQFSWSPQGSTTGNTLIALTKANLENSVPTLATLTLWNTKNGKLKAILAANARDIKAAYSADGRAVVALIDGTPRGWDENGFAINVASLPALPCGTTELCPRLLTRQGQIMRALRKGKTAFIETRAVLNGKVASYDFPMPFNGNSLAPKQLFVAPDGSSVAVQQANGALALWNLNNWELLGHVELKSSENIVIAPAPGGRLVAVAQPEGAIQIYDPALSSLPLTLQVLPSLKPRRGGQEWAVFSPDGFCNTSPQASRQLRRLAAGKMPLP